MSQVFSARLWTSWNVSEWFLEEFEAHEKIVLESGFHNFNFLDFLTPTMRYFLLDLMIIPWVKKSFNEYKIVSLALFELILMFYASKNIIYILDEEMKWNSKISIFPL